MSRRLGLAVLFAALLAAPARGDTLEEFGFGARAQGMGNAFTAVATDPTATYYNPAGLIFSRHVNLQLGFSFADYQLRFSSQRGGRLDDEAERIPDRAVISLGLSTTIDLDIPNRLGLGVALVTPTRGIVDLEAKAIGSEPEWFRYGKRHDRLDLFIALAAKVTDWLSVGAGATLLVGVTGGTTISAGLNTPVDPSFEAKATPSARAIVGVLFTPNDLVSIGVTYRSEVSVDIEFPAAAVLQGIDLPLGLDAKQLFSPHQVQVGASFAPTDRLLLSLDLLWSNWSAYRTLFIVTTSDTVSTIPTTRADLRDVISPRLGAEYVLTDWLLLRGGYMYRSSVVADQDFAPTNLADSDKHVFTLGVGLAFGSAPEDAGEKPKLKRRAQTWQELTADASVDVDLFFQYHLHTPVSARKGASDPIGDWDASGGIVNFGFTVTARF